MRRTVGYTAFEERCQLIYDQEPFGLLFICVRLQVVITLHQAIRLVHVQINSVEVYNQYQSLHGRTPLLFVVSDKHSGRQLNFLCCFLYL